jgi:transcription antitermination factor NusG
MSYLAYSSPDVVPDTTRESLSGPVSSWFAVQTWPRYEKRIASQLQEKGVEVFLPLLHERHQWSDRRTVVHAPLFPSYVFVRIADTPSTRVPVLRTSGVARFVGGRNTGSPIPDSEIESIQAVLSNGAAYREHPFLNIGQRVRIRGGSLDGVEGILAAKSDGASLLVSIEIIQRSLAVRIAGYHVEPL